MANVTKKTIPASAGDGSYAKISTVKIALRSKVFPLVVLIVLLLILFTILGPMRNNGLQSFFRSSTFFMILQNLAVPGFLTIGVALVLVSGGFDISAAACGSLSGIIVAVGTAWWNLHWIVAVVLALVIAACVGLFNAFLVNDLNLMPFVATMGTSTILSAVMQILLTDNFGQTLGMLSIQNAGVKSIADAELFGEVPVAALIMVIFFAIYGLALARSKFGKTLYLIGGNRVATHLAGIKPKKISYFLYINCSVLAALAGVINLSRTMAGSTLALSSLQFTGVTAAMLGGISFGGGSGGLGGAFVGLVALQMFNVGMTTSRGTPYLNTVLAGALLILALTFDFFNTRRQNKRVGA